jgi:ABC-2 type transport system ATP-binding protein
MSDMTSPAILAENLSKAFGPVVAVDGLNLSLAPGEIFGLIGPDGAGKTTTIRLLSAVMEPTRGRALVAGHDTVREAEAIRRAVGYMPQRFTLYGDLTVRENLDFFADVFAVRGAERRRRIAQALEFSRLGEFQQRRAANLSGGMQKKLALASVLLHRPAILFLDEPTTGVDPISRREFWDLLTELHLPGFTLFISTPYMDEAERCSRVGLLYQGRLMVCDDPARVPDLVPGDWLEVRTPALAEAQAVLKTLPGVAQVQVYGDLLHVAVDAAAARAPEIAAALAGRGVPVTSLRPDRPRLEEAFVALIEARERRAMDSLSPTGR